MNFTKIKKFHACPCVKKKDPDTRECTQELFERLLDLEQVQKAADQLQTLKKDWESGRITQNEYDDRASAVKTSLPSICWQASFSPEVKKNENAVPSGLALLDADHVPAEVMDRIKQMCEHQQVYLNYHGIGYVAASIRQEGIHVAFRLLEGETIEEGQLRMARALGLEPWMDRACKDLQRPMFLSPRSLTWYVDDNMLWAEGEQQEQQEQQEQVLSEESLVESIDLTDPAPGRTATVTEVPTFSDEDLTSFPDSYGDLSYEDIADEYISQHGGYPHEGNRNNFLLSMSRAFAPIVDNNPDWLYTVLPHFGQKPSAVQDMCRRTCEKNFTLSRDMRGILAAVASKKRSEADQTTLLTDDELKDFPRALRVSLKAVPPQQRFALLVLLLPICAMYATDAKVCHLSDKPHLKGAVMPLNLFGVALASTTGGKQMLNYVSEIWMALQRQKDKKASDDWNAWKRLSQAEREKRPEPPHGHRVNELVSEAALAQCLVENNGQCVLLQSSEARGIATQQHAGVWSRIDTPLMKAFDEAYWDRTRVSVDSVSCSVKAHLCLSVTGTYGALWEMLSVSGNAFENGFANRLMLADFPVQHFALPPHHHELTTTEIEAIHEAIGRLIDAKGVIDMPQTRKAIWHWVVDKAREAAASADTVMDELRKRCAAMAMRCATLFHIMEGSARESIACVDFAIRMADYIFEQQLHLFGDAIRKQHKQQDAARFSLNYSSYKTPINDGLVARLADEFTIDDVHALKPGCSRESCKTMCSRWKSKGLIKPLGKGKYRKSNLTINI